MAGAVRQPIDQASLERYLQAEVPRIVTPVEIKQVCDVPIIIISSTAIASG